MLEQAGQAIASAPVVCELCRMGFAGHDKLAQHCRKKHGGLAEYRKRVFHKAGEAGPCPLLPWNRRNMAQGFRFFRKPSVPNSFNDLTSKAATEARPREEQACALCTVKGWQENRAEMYLFKKATGTTSWKKQFYAGGDADDELGPASVTLNVTLYTARCQADRRGRRARCQADRRGRRFAPKGSES